MSDLLSYASFVWVLPTVSLLWKRQMLKGGSWVAKTVKEDALKAKKQKRRRLGDFLRDDLLRNQMVKRFLKDMTQEQCDQHMKELDLMASQEVTPDDVRVATGDILDNVMWRIWLGLCAWLFLGYMVCGETETEYLYIVVFFLWMIIHMVDNKMHVSSFEMSMVGCCGVKPKLDDEEDEALLNV